MSRKTTTGGGADPATVARYLFGLTLLLFLVSSFFPSARVWGLNVWGHLPVYVPILLTIAGVAIVPLERYWSSRQKSGETVPANELAGRYVLYSALIICVFAALIYFLRARTHFLGDGDSLLAELAKPLPLVKPRETGSGLVLVWMKGFIGGDRQAASLLAYQTVSIVSGVLFALIAAIGSGLLFPRLGERLLMLTGLLVGGYALMFFGYVENYAPLAVGILLFGVLGLLIAENRANKWLILIPLALTCFFHILGTLLIPAALYLLAAHTKLAARISRASRANKSLVVGTIVVLGLVAFGYLYQTDYYFRFAFVPILPDRFSIKGYTLFSIAHIADVINLLFLLVPGFLVSFALFRTQPLKMLFGTRSARFLLVTAISTLFAVCVLDPKLGMPRDWDLFSLPAIPVTLLAMCLMLTKRSGSPTHVTAAILYVALAAFSLVPRAVVQALPVPSVALFTGYLELDPLRARTGMHNLAIYFVARGDTAAAVRSEERRMELFPYEEYIRQSDSAANLNVDVAKSYAQKALALNATYADTWVMLAWCYIEERKYDSALECAKIADGLNPYNTLIRNAMALSYSYLHNTDAAIRIWRDLADRDTSAYDAPYNLARIYLLNGDPAQYERYLAEAARRIGAPFDLSIELARYTLQKGDVPTAATACRQALAKGADSVQVAALARTSPKLAELLGLPR